MASSTDRRWMMAASRRSVAVTIPTIAILDQHRIDFVGFHRQRGFVDGRSAVTKTGG